MTQEKKRTQTLTEGVVPVEVREGSHMLLCGGRRGIDKSKEDHVRVPQASPRRQVVRNLLSRHTNVHRSQRTAAKYGEQQVSGSVSSDRHPRRLPRAGRRDGVRWVADDRLLEKREANRTSCTRTPPNDTVSTPSMFRRELRRGLVAGRIPKTGATDDPSKPTINGRSRDPPTLPPSVAITHVDRPPSDPPAIAARLRLSHKPTSPRTEDVMTFHYLHPSLVDPYPMVADREGYLQLENTERKIKDFLKRTSAAAAKELKSTSIDLLGPKSNIETARPQLKGFVGPEERKRQFSKVYHLEAPRALSVLTESAASGNSPIDSDSSPGRSESPLVLPPITLPPLRREGHPGDTVCLAKARSTEKVSKALTGRDWRQIRRCRYLRLGPKQVGDGVGMRELSVKDVFRK